MTTRRVSVACLGNRFRGDDAVGLAVAEGIRAAGGAVEECEDEPIRLLDGWEDLDLLVLVDAVRSGSSPGTVHRVDASARALPDDLTLTSSHAFGISQTLELARALGKLPARVVLYGIEGGHFGAGAGLTPSVAAAVPNVVAAVVRELENGG